MDFDDPLGFALPEPSAKEKKEKKEKSTAGTGKGDKKEKSKKKKSKKCKGDKKDGKKEKPKAKPHAVKDGKEEKPVAKRPAMKQQPEAAEPSTNPLGTATWGNLPKAPLAGVRVGVDCAGIMPETFALAADGIKHSVAFATEMNTAKQRIIKFLHGDIKLYDTVIERNSDKQAGECDLLVGGFPCQPFSAVGKHGGTTDKRGIVVFQIAEYIGKWRPRAFVLENVKGLVYQHWEEFKD